MKMELGIWSIVTASLCSCLGGCIWDTTSPHAQVEERLGARIYQEIQHPMAVTYFVVEQDMSERPLSDALRWLLQQTLLDDDSYLLHRTKQCPFVPELAFHFKGSEDLFIYLSFSCRQIKVVSQDKSIILDIDPKMDEMEANFKDLLQTR